MPHVLNVGFRQTLRRLLGLQFRQLLHQAAFAAGDVVAMKNALRRGFVQLLDRLTGRLDRAVQIAPFDGGAGFFDPGASLRADDPVTQPFFLGITYSFKG